MANKEEEKSNLRSPNKPSSQDDDFLPVAKTERKNAIAALEAEKRQLYKDLKSSLGEEEADEHIK